MPTYEYKCKKCAHQFEELQSITADALTNCPKCDGTIERIISGGAGFVFKGSGFYITENRSAGYKEAAQKDSEPKATTKSDSKKSKEKKTEAKKPKTESKKE